MESSPISTENIRLSFIVSKFIILQVILDYTLFTGMVSSTSFKAYACYGLTFAGHIFPIFGSIVRTGDTAGCGTPHTVDGASHNHSVSTNGGKRDYRLHLPSSYDPNTPAPVVISYHGHGRNMVEQETLSQFSNDAINPSMIAVYPQGLKGAVSRTPSSLSQIFPRSIFPRSIFPRSIFPRSIFPRSIFP